MYFFEIVQYSTPKKKKTFCCNFEISRFQCLILLSLLYPISFGWEVFLWKLTYVVVNLGLYKFVYRCVCEYSVHALACERFVCVCVREVCLCVCVLLCVCVCVSVCVFKKALEKKERLRVIREKRTSTVSFVNLHKKRSKSWFS